MEKLKYFVCILLSLFLIIIVVYNYTSGFWDYDNSFRKNIRDKYFAAIWALIGAIIGGLFSYYGIKLKIKKTFEHDLYKMKYQFLYNELIKFEKEVKVPIKNMNEQINKIPEDCSNNILSGFNKKDAENKANRFNVLHIEFERTLPNRLYNKHEKLVKAYKEVVENPCRNTVDNYYNCLKKYNYEFRKYLDVEKIFADTSKEEKYKD